MVPFALLHLGKAELETMTTWLSGVGFGFVAWRTQSFLYAFLIHWFMLVMTILIAVGSLG
jgi:membrane protease YdiL (CAAX protease family)